jgi:hypothetical protein
VLGQKIVTLFRKPGDQVLKKPFYPIRIQVSFILKGEEMYLVVANFMSESFVLATVHTGQVKMFL